MADHISNIVDLVHPAPSGIGIILGSKPWILFNCAIDESTVEKGNFFLTGPDFDTWSGPDLQLFLDTVSLGDESQILQSPGYEGLVCGEITFQRIDLNSLDEVATIDTVGSGLLYRSKAIFTPTNRFQANTIYRVFLSGDEDSTDALQTGISRCTVFDTIAGIGNQGTGSCKFTGGYIGFVDTDTYTVTITTSGNIDEAKFSFVRSSDPVSIFGPFYVRKNGVLLSDGVTAEFTEDSYVSGDTWSVVVKERNIYLGNLNWEFKTGSGSITTPPISASTSAIGEPILTTTVAAATTDTLSVPSTTPLDLASHLTISAATPYPVTVVFNKNISLATLTNNISIVSESVTGETDVPALGELTFTYTLSGKTLSILIDEEQIYSNNLITITLNEKITDTLGLALTGGYSFSFTSTYTPYYCTLRQLRLRVGAFINQLADDTLNLAIHFSSKEAEALTWNKQNLDDAYYKFVRNQWVVCRSAQILLSNVIGGGGLKSKKLGDLEVAYNSQDALKPLNLIEECLARWEGALIAGGLQVQSPQGVVKGDLDIDRPPIGRGWLHERGILPSTPMINQRTRPVNALGEVSRRYRGIYRNVFTRRGWWKR